MNAITKIVTVNYQEDEVPNAAKIDKKRFGWLLSPALPVIGIGILAGYHFGPKKTKKIFALGGPLLLHVIIPTLDALIGEDDSNPQDEDIQTLQNDPYYDRIVKCYIPLQMAANAFASYVVTRPKVSLMDQIFLGISMGAINGVGVNTAHELCHRPQNKDHYWSHASLMPLAYNHFRIEHPYGHHKRVATPEDPASSQMGESFYAFLPRTIIGGLKSAIKIEKRRLARKGLGFWHWQNELFHGWAMSALYHASLMTIFGKKVLPYNITQAMYGVSLFEIINYVEHYGLKRAKKADGTYERTLPEHSWNNNNIVTNLFLYQLQRHSDHHAYPSRPFQTLRHFDEAPELPSGYATMLIPALIPQLWFRMMDQRVFEHYAGDLSKANIYPPQKQRIYQKFHYVEV